MQRYKRHVSLGRGVIMFKEIANVFLKDENIAKVYISNENQEIFITLVLFSDEVDQLALGLVKLLNEAATLFPQYEIDMTYFTMAYAECYIPENKNEVYFKEEVIS